MWLRKAEREIGDETSFFRALFDSANVGIVLSDMRGRALEANPAVVRMFGYSRNELEKMCFSDFIRQDEMDESKELFKKLTSGENDTCDVERRYLKNNGRNMWARVSASLVRDPAGKPRFVLGMVQDITQCKNAEQALSESEAAYRSLMDNCPDGVAIIQGGKINYVNASFGRMFGYAGGKLVGQNMLKVVSPQDRLAVEERMVKMLAGIEVPLRYTFRGITKDRKMIFVEVSAAVFIDYKQIPAIAVVLRDVTEKKHRENELAEYRDRLERMVKKRTAKLTQVNRELRRETKESERIKKSLEQSEAQLRKQKACLERKNAALHELLGLIETEKKQARDDVATNINVELLPVLHKLRNNGTKIERGYLDVLEHSLGKMASSFSRRITEPGLKLTPREIEICNIIRGGTCSKDASHLLGISPKTVERHRRDIRKKLDLCGRKINLVSFLQSI